MYTSPLLGGVFSGRIRFFCVIRLTDCRDRRPAQVSDNARVSVAPPIRAECISYADHGLIFTLFVLRVLRPLSPTG